MSELANDNFNSERVFCRFARLLRCVAGPRAANRRGRDKANWRSLAPFGRKGLSAHWILQVFAASKWPSAMCTGAVLRIFPTNFNLVRDGARNVHRGEATLFVRYRAR
jgi:hypothetical protein